MNIFGWGKKNKKFSDHEQDQKAQEIELKQQLASLNTSHCKLENSAREVSKVATETADYLSRELENTMYRFFTVIDNMVDVVIIRNPDSEWQTVNRFTQELLGLHISDYYQKPNSEIHNIENYFDTHHDLLTDQLAWHRGESVRVMLDVVDVHGTTRHFDVIKTPTYQKHDNKKPKELIVIGREITDIRTSEQRNRVCLDALNCASDIIIISDSNTNIIFCNNSFIETFGFKNLDEVEGRPIKILCSGKHDHDFFQNIRETTGNNKNWYGLIYNQAVNGDIIPCETTIIPVMNGADTPVYFIQVMKVKNTYF